MGKHLWRPTQAPEEVPADRAERTLKAISDQRQFRRFPGYTGCAPGPAPAPLPPKEDAHTESRTGELTVKAPLSRTREGEESSRGPSIGVLGSAGRSRVLDRGSGPLTARDYTKISKVAEYHLTPTTTPRVAPEQIRLAASVRDHCTQRIPGYMGHVPRVKGESLCGLTAMDANRVAADFVDDRIFKPESHHEMCLNPRCRLVR